MAEECRFYYYDHGYSCALKRESDGISSIDSDIVHRYCWGYHYEECPRYQSGLSSGGGCYLTSACVEAIGLGDDCYELVTLRAFRDSYMRNTPNGPADICEYYRTAPLIVSKIKELANANAIFEKIYLELVRPCIKLIECKKNEDAYMLYRDYSRKLQKQYIEDFL
ncbi:MAG: CFI-box-CTERM domain-containing protein [Faecousia sp.]